MPDPGGGFVGFTNVPADKFGPVAGFGSGFGSLSLRADLADSYRAALARVRALGGRLTSSGAVRELAAQVSAGRSATSLHYTGRALDLFIGSGMQGPNDPYVVVRDGGGDDHPLWKVFCVVDAAAPDDPLTAERELPAAVHRKGTATGFAAQPRRVRCFSVTDVLAQFGWVRIPSRLAYRTDYLSVEWWHFQNQSGLVDGRTRFGDELRAVWPAAKVAASGLALNAVWSSQSFKVPAMRGGRSGAEPDDPGGADLGGPPLEEGEGTRRPGDEGTRG
jgi:hypothetical protein